LGHSLATAKVVEEPDPLKSKAGKCPIFVMKMVKKLVQLDHRTRKGDFISTLDPEFLKEIFPPFLGHRVMGDARFIDRPERKVRVLVPKMAEQFFDLFSWGGRQLCVIL
jgi:hypothetical protein